MEKRNYFKEGDVLTKGSWIFIYAGIAEPICEGDGYPIVFHALIHVFEPKLDVLATRHGIDCINSKCKIKFASRFDKEILNKRLNEHGYCWNNDRMELVRIAEKPKKEIVESFYNKDRRPNPYNTY